MRTICLALLGILVACTSDVAFKPAPMISAVPDAWSGGTLALHSSALLGTSSPPTLTAGSHTLAIVTSGGDSVLVQLPDTNGLVTLDVAVAGFEHARVPVQVHGFVSYAPGPVVDGTPNPWPSGGEPTALAIQLGKLVLLNYRTRTAVQMRPESTLGPWPIGCHDTWPEPIPSFDDSQLIAVPTACNSIVAFPVGAGTATPDTAPAPFAVGYGALHVGRGKWLVNSRTALTFATRQADGSFSYGPQVANRLPLTFAISPRRDRGIGLSTLVNLTDVSVFDPSAASVAYTLSGVRGVSGAAFSDHGDTLFVVAFSDSSTVAVNSYDATSGGFLAGSPLSRRAWGYSVAADQGRRWLYVAGADDTVLVVHVYDRTTLTRVAALRAPRSGDLLPYTERPVIVLDPARRRLYLTMNLSPAQDTNVFEFDLVP